MRTLLYGLVAALLMASGPALAKEYLITGAKPNKLVVIDPAARKVDRILEIPGPGVAPGTIVPSPDGKTAYVITNRLESVSGIDLNSGKEVFRADFPSGDIRAKAMFAMAVSPDGKELFVLIAPVRIGPDEYEVQDTYIAVYDTAAGIGAEPVRTMPAPRRLVLFAFSEDGQTLWALGWDLYGMDPQTGAIRQTHAITNWDRPNYATPDVLDVWPQFEQADVFSTPYFAARTDRDPETDPEAFKTGLVTLDLATGEAKIQDFENTSVVIFSSVVNPVNKDEVFSVYTQLSKIDHGEGRLVERVDLPHTYYAINISGDGKELYLGGTMCDVGVHSAETLERLATIEIPDCPDQALASLRVVNW